ncbi:hypothetical protein B0H21DRAFT_712154 [Amylocystis lapponica]|nr:hypothetical protein B0H21DRAFT_712154 [Amylocystis lapponica]
MPSTLEQAEKALLEKRASRAVLNRTIKVDILKELCERYNLDVTSTGKTKAVKCDYLNALLEYPVPHSHGVRAEQSRLTIRIPGRKHMAPREELPTSEPAHVKTTAVLQDVQQPLMIRIRPRKRDAPKGVRERSPSPKRTHVDQATVRESISRCSSQSIAANEMHRKADMISRLLLSEHTWTKRFAIAPEEQQRARNTTSAANYMSTQIVRMYGHQDGVVPPAPITGKRKVHDDRSKNEGSKPSKRQRTKQKKQKSGGQRSIRIRLYKCVKDWSSIKEIDYIPLTSGDVNLTQVINTKNYHPFHDYNDGILHKNDVEILMKDNALRTMCSRQQRVVSARAAVNAKQATDNIGGDETNMRSEGQRAVCLGTALLYCVIQQPVR